MEYLNDALESLHEDVARAIGIAATEFPEALSMEMVVENVEERLSLLLDAIRWFDVWSGRCEGCGHPESAHSLPSDPDEVGDKAVCSARGCRCPGFSVAGDE